MLSAAQGLPFAFLITDGCVENERDIVRWVGLMVTSSQGGIKASQGLG